MKRHHIEGFATVKIRHMWEADVIFYEHFHNLKRNLKEKLFHFCVKMDYQICTQSDLFSMRKKSFTDKSCLNYIFNVNLNYPSLCKTYMKKPKYSDKIETVNSDKIKLYWHNHLKKQGSSTEHHFPVENFLMRTVLTSIDSLWYVISSPNSMSTSHFLEKKKYKTQNVCRVV